MFSELMVLAYFIKKVFTISNLNNRLFNASIYNYAMSPDTKPSLTILLQGQIFSLRTVPFVSTATTFKCSAYGARVRLYETTLSFLFIHLVMFCSVADSSMHLKCFLLYVCECLCIHSYVKENARNFPWFPLSIYSKPQTTILPLLSKVCFI